MKRNRYTIFTIVIMVLIFILSNDMADESSQKSGLIVLMLRCLFPDGNVNSLSFIVRKSAHMFIYGMLGISSFLSFYENNRNKRKSLISMFFFCLLYAISDEVHQLFVPGRAGMISDVGFDLLGSLCGGILISIIYDRRSK